LLNNIPAVIGSILMVLSKCIGSFEVFIIGRILIGFSAGLDFNLKKKAFHFLLEKVLAQLSDRCI
jgi:MFS family permease